jgi:hypothetical protein
MNTPRFTRRELRKGGGNSLEEAADHFLEMLGSVEFRMYRSPNAKLKGYDSLKAALEAGGCEAVHLPDAPTPMGGKYETIRITVQGREIPEPLLKRAHNWAHQRNLLHMFHKKG